MLLAYSTLKQEPTTLNIASDFPPLTQMLVWYFNKVTAASFHIVSIA
jgi:hypothetical protein